MAVDLRAVLESYRFTREEMQEFVRGLFRGDYAKEREEIEACKVSLPSGENGNDQTESSVPEMMIMEPSRPGENAPIAATTPPPDPPQPERKGLWGRLKDKFSK